VQLLGAAFDRARRNGHRVCHLDVASDNPAVGFYELMGMEILSESRVLPLQKHGIASNIGWSRGSRCTLHGEGAAGGGGRP